MCHTRALAQPALCLQESNTKFFAQVSFKSVSYDQDLYGGGKPDGSFDSSIAGLHYLLCHSLYSVCVCMYSCLFFWNLFSSTVDDDEFEAEAERSARSRLQDKQQQSKKT